MSGINFDFWADPQYQEIKATIGNLPREDCLLTTSTHAEYIGSFTKTLNPGVRLGFLVAPPRSLICSTHSWGALRRPARSSPNKLCRASWLEGTVSALVLSWNR